MPMPDVTGQMVFLTQIGAVSVDVSLSQVHRFPTRITENPVEDGTTFSDHVVLLPTSVEIDARVSDSPVSLVGEFGKGTAQDAYNTLVKMQKDREPFDVVTGLNTYHNMLLEDLQIPRLPGDGRSIRFTAVLREIIVVGLDRPTNRDLVAEDVRHTALPVTVAGLVTKLAQSSAVPASATLVSNR